MLTYDPFGFYKSKSIYTVEKDPNVPFYEDFPVDDYEWFLGKTYVNLGKLKVVDRELQEQLATVTELPQIEATIKTVGEDHGHHGH